MPTVEMTPARAAVQRSEAWWLTGCGLLLILASDFDWRVRDVTASLEGQVDLAVAVEVLAYGAVAAYLLLRVLDPPSSAGRPNPLLVPVWAFATIAILSSVYAPTPLMALVRGAQLLVVALLCQAIATHASRDQLHRFVHGFLVLCCAAVVIGIVAPFPRMALETNRFNFLYVHPVQAGTILGLGVVCSAAYLAATISDRRGQLWPPSVYGAVLVVVGGGLVMTITRSAIGGAVLGVVTVLVLAARRYRFDVLVFAAVGTALTWLLAGPLIVAFLVRGQTAESLQSLNARTTLWEVASERFLERPFTGHGLTATRSLFLEDLGLGGAHNALVEVVVDLGIIGLTAWLGMLLLIVVGLVRARPAGGAVSADVLVLSGVLAFLVVNGVGTEGAGTAANIQSLWLFLIVGWSSVLRSESSRLPATATD